jgi:DNA polymerase-3 subunit delta
MRRIPEKEMAKAIGVSPYYLKEYLGSLQHFDRRALDRALSSLLAADFELKGGSARNERLIMSLLFHRMLLPHGYSTGRSA